MIGAVTDSAGARGAVVVSIVGVNRLSAFGTGAGLAAVTVSVWVGLTSNSEVGFDGCSCLATGSGGDDGSGSLAIGGTLALAVVSAADSVETIGAAFGTGTTTTWLLAVGPVAC